MFTRQHYEAVAAVLAQDYDSETGDNGLDPNAEAECDTYARGVHDVVDLLTDLFRKDNPNFDSYRFKQAANLDRIPY